MLSHLGSFDYMQGLGKKSQYLALILHFLRIDVYTMRDMQKIESDSDFACRLSIRARWIRRFFFS